jgi:hypothetical protein
MSRGVGCVVSDLVPVPEARKGRDDGNIAEPAGPGGIDVVEDRGE